MKTIFRIVLVACLALVVYFGTIGRADFYRLLDAISDAIQVIGNNYLKK